MFLPTFSFAFRMVMRVINGDTESELSKCIVWNRRTCCQVIRTKLERVSSFFVILSTCRFARTHRYIYCWLKKSCETWNMEACQALIQCKFCFRVQIIIRGRIFWLLFVWTFRVLFTICFVFRLCVSCASHTTFCMYSDISIFHVNLLISVL